MESEPGPPDKIDSPSAGKAIFGAMKRKFSRGELSRVSSSDNLSDSEKSRGRGELSVPTGARDARSKSPLGQSGAWETQSSHMSPSASSVDFQPPPCSDSEGEDEEDLDMLSVAHAHAQASRGKVHAPTATQRDQVIPPEGVKEVPHAIASPRNMKPRVQELNIEPRSSVPERLFEKMPRPQSPDTPGSPAGPFSAPVSPFGDVKNRPLDPSIMRERAQRTKDMQGEVTQENRPHTPDGRLVPDRESEHVESPLPRPMTALGNAEDVPSPKLFKAKPSIPIVAPEKSSPRPPSPLRALPTPPEQTPPVVVAIDKQNPLEVVAVDAVETYAKPPMSGSGTGWQEASLSGVAATESNPSTRVRDSSSFVEEMPIGVHQQIPTNNHEAPRESLPAPQPPPGAPSEEEDDKKVEKKKKKKFEKVKNYFGYTSKPGAPKPKKEPPKPVALAREAEHKDSPRAKNLGGPLAGPMRAIDSSTTPLQFPPPGHPLHSELPPENPEPHRPHPVATSPPVASSPPTGLPPNKAMALSPSSTRRAQAPPYVATTPPLPAAHHVGPVGQDGSPPTTGSTHSGNFSPHQSIDSARSNEFGYHSARSYELESHRSDGYMPQFQQRPANVAPLDMGRLQNGGYLSPGGHTHPPPHPDYRHQQHYNRQPQYSPHQDHLPPPGYDPRFDPRLAYDPNTGVYYERPRSAEVPPTPHTPPMYPNSYPNHYQAPPSPQYYDAAQPPPSPQYYDAQQSPVPRRHSTGQQQQRGVSPGSPVPRRSPGRDQGLSNQLGMDVVINSPEISQAKSGVNLEDCFMPKEHEVVFSQARHGRYDEIKDALMRGAPLNGKDKNGNTLLHTACQNGRKKLVKIFARLGGNIDSQNFKGHTALHFCYAYNYPVLAHMLLKLGARTDIVNEHGLTCFEGIKPRSDSASSGSVPSLPPSGKVSVAIS